MAGDAKGKSDPFNMLKSTIMGLSRPVQIGMVIALVVLIIALKMYGNYNAQFKLVPLYDKALSVDDVEEIKLKLSEMGYVQGKEFDVIAGGEEGGGSKILIQQALREKIRGKLATLGLPRRPLTTFDTMEKPSISSTDDERKAAQLRAKEGELASAIREMEGINDARVNIVLAKDALFEEEQQPAKATVMISPRYGFRISKVQIEGIINMVAGAVEGLAPENVTVVDTRGVTLSKLVEFNKDPYGLPSSDEMKDKQTEFEEMLTRRAQAMLDQTVGPNKAVVQVNATLDFSKKKTQMELYGGPVSGGNAPFTSAPATSSDKEEGGYVTIGGRVVQAAARTTTKTDELTSGSTGSHVISEQVATETYKGGGSLEDVSPAGGEKSGATDYSTSNITRNYALDRTVTEKIEAPGKVERMTVALMLDNINPQYVDQIKDAVAACVGLDYSRGDEIKVINMPFARNISQEMANSMLNTPAGYERPYSAVPKINTKQFLAIVSIPVILLLVLLVMFMVKQKKSEEEKTKLLLTTGTGSIGVNPITDLLSDKSGRTVAPGVNRGSQEQLTRLAKERPSEVAKLLKSSWLKEK